jgi:hypothetical protein
MASNLQPDEQEPVLDCDALALWLALPPSFLLSRLDDQLGGVVPSSPELAYLRKELISILCQLLIGTRNLWRLRCAGDFEQSTEFTAMTCGRLTPKVSLFSQRTISSYFPSLPFNLSLDPPLLDSQEVGPLDLQGPRLSQPSQAPPWEPPWEPSSSGFSLLSPMSPVLPAVSSPSTSRGTGGVGAGCSPSSLAQGLFPVHGSLLKGGPDRPSPKASIPSASASLSGSVSSTPTPSEDWEYAFPYFLSVQDLASVPDCTINLILFTLSSAGMSGVPSAEVVVPTSRVSLKPPPVSRPKRSTRVNMGYTAELVLLLDVSTVGRIPPSFQVNRVSEDVQYEQGSHDFEESWVQPSHFCVGPLLQGGAVRARIGVYEGRCNKNMDDYAAALVRFAASDYVLSDKPHRFVVDGQHNDVISEPARSNVNFNIVNCYFAYNPTLRRLELITIAPLKEEIYKALTDYDTPGELPAYWTAERLSYLSDEARARCLAYYHP